MKVKMPRANSGNWTWLSAQSDVKGTGDAPGADALKQDLDLVVGQSEMVTEKQPCPTEEARWDMREQLGMKKQKEREIQESTCFTWQILSSFQVFFLLCIHQKRFCSTTGKSDPQISVTYTHTHTEKCLHTHTFIYRHIHTLITTYRCLWSVRLLHMHHLEQVASVTGKRERLQRCTWAFHASTWKWHRRHHPCFIAQSESWE